MSNSTLKQSALSLSCKLSVLIQYERNDEAKNLLHNCNMAKRYVCLAHLAKINGLDCIEAFINEEIQLNEEERNYQIK